MDLMAPERFTGSFTQQEPIPEEGIEAAVAVLRHGRLHRYNTAPGEVAETALLEEEFAALVGAKYCLAVASGGYALGCALRAVGVKAGDRVLTNAFTLAPVPGSIASVGARPVFVEVTEDLTIDLPHLEDTGCAGIGLFRTELQFMVSATMPRLERQIQMYREIVVEAKGKPVGQALVACSDSRRAAELVEHRDRLERRTRETCRLGSWVTPRVRDWALGQTEKVSAKANRVFDQCDVLLTPTLGAQLPPVGEYDPHALTSPSRLGSASTRVNSGMRA